MKYRSLILVVVVLIGILVIIVMVDYKRSKPGNREANPYEYNIDTYREVDSALINYHEFRQLNLQGDSSYAFAWFDQLIYLLSDKGVSIISESGEIKSGWILSKKSHCIDVDKEIIAVGYRNKIEIYDRRGELKKSSDTLDGKSYFTALALGDTAIYVADAGARKIWIFNHNLKVVGEIEGESGPRSIHGFIIPSPYFDLNINHLGELWVVNSGLHSLQHYNDRGSLINAWEKISLDIDGFSGCCNPAHFCFSSEGNFITSEKGLVRVKEYDTQGNLISVIAPPKLFSGGEIAPDVIVNDRGEILLLDFNTNTIRFFQKNKIDE